VNSIAETSIAIIGGGCSGTLLAAQLLRQSFTGSITIVEPRPELGMGLAYSTPFDEHLLNVPAGKISAFSDEPFHFLDWLHDHHCPFSTPFTFAPRKRYGEYLNDVLHREIVRAPQTEVSHLNVEAIDIKIEDNLAKVVLVDGEVLKTKTVVLALGNPASSPMVEAASVGNIQRLEASPWHDLALRLRNMHERVLLLGTGLTAVDSMLALLAQSEDAQIFMLSRRGLLPQSHAVCQPLPGLPELSVPPRVSSLVRHLRQRIEALRSRGYCWRTAIDELRPISNRLWHELSLNEKRRFSRHVKPYWESHRHRMAPEITTQAARHRIEGRLSVMAGRIRDVQRADNIIEVQISLNCGPELLLEVDRIINCTGIHEDYNSSSRPLIRSIISRGLACANDLGLGFRTDSNGTLIEADGHSSLHLFTLGPTLRGELFETTAVPEIRSQAEALAHYLISNIPSGEA
jgi:uncharacterized NAD(P)/FAD-binding protein YdhS